MRSPVPAGTFLGGFRVETVVGDGATGTVYLAEEPGQGGPVALKLLAPELARDERFRQRFLREAQLPASLDHPNIVSTLPAGEGGGALYLAMAYIRVWDLRRLCALEGGVDP